MVDTGYGKRTSQLGPSWRRTRPRHLQVRRRIIHKKSPGQIGKSDWWKSGFGESPKGESQSNGAIEEAGKTVREFARLFKDVIETNVKRRIDANDPIMLWLVRWAAVVAYRYLVGKDGRTAYERKRGRRCKMPLAIFGEKVLYKPLDHQKDKGK